MNKSFVTAPYLDRSRFDSSPSGQFPFSISMLSWAYNEEENILGFLQRAKQYMDRLGVDYEHILIDDCSTDNTVQIAIQHQKHYPQLKIIRHPVNRDVGWAIRTSVSHASKDIFFWQTVDWSYDIEKLPGYLWLLKDYDVVQGVRIPDSRSVESASFFPSKLLKLKYRADNRKRAFQSLINYLVIRFLYNVPLLDFQNVSIYPTRFAQSLNLETHSAFTNPEVIIKAYWRGAKIKQVPIGFIPRKNGTGKGCRWKTIRGAAADILYFWFKWKVLGHSEVRKIHNITIPANVPS